MSEEPPTPRIDLNKLRDDVLAGRDTGYTPPDFNNLTPQQLHDTHFVNPGAHPDYNPGPSLEELRKALEEQKAQEKQSETSDQAQP